MKTFKLIGLLLFGLFTAVSVTRAAETDVDRLVDLLIQKGTISREEASGFRADLAVKKQEEKEAQKEFLVISGKPVTLSGFIQVLYKQDQKDIDSFSIRRARLSIKSDVSERFDYEFLGDFAGASAKVLDAIVGYKFSSLLKLTAGQFKIPLSPENLASDSKSDTINRSQVVEALVARGKDVIGNHNGRDIGGQASGSLIQRDEYNPIEYQAGVFNGSGINTTDTNEQKDVAGRLVYRPFKSLALGGAYYSGFYTLTTAPTKIDDRKRSAGELIYTADNFSVKGEYIAGTDAKTEKEGWYALVGYYIVPNKVQAVVKYDIFDANKNISNDEATVYTYGLNYQPVKGAYVQLNYERKVEKPADADNDTIQTQITLQF